MKFWQNEKAVKADMQCAGQLAAQTLWNGEKVLFSGNRGSAADSQHLAAELTGRFI